MARVLFVARWTLGTCGGWVAGLVAWFALVWLGWEALPHLLRLPYNALNVWRLAVYVLALAALGACVAYGQWQAAFRGRVFPGWDWVRAGAAGGALALLAFVLASLLPLPVFPPEFGLSDNPALWRVEATWLPGTLLFGLALGVCVGLPQALVIRRYLRGARWWLLAALLACSLCALAFVLVVQRWGGGFWPLLLNTLLPPLLFGALTGVAMLRYVNKG
ncbi:MAG: hypothetical protein HXY40_03645 [Chloroflexi bacterium]|nr:hypothetical protein [Chloroflexota bacterium]